VVSRSELIPRGVIYYNTGFKGLARLLVSLHSLRKHWDGPVTVLSEGEDSSSKCREFAKVGLCDVREIDVTIPPGIQTAFLKKTLTHKTTPYQLNIFLDFDTLIRGDITELFDLAEKHQFVATNFAGWRSDGRTMVKRIRNWLPYYPKDLVEGAIPFGPAINAGTFAYDRDAKFHDDWYNLTLPGRHLNLPEETCMQVHLRFYPHFVADQKYNCSCKHSTPHHPDTRIIHYHGRKHCRSGLPYGGDLWIKEWEEVEKKNIAGVKRWGQRVDRYLRRHLNEHDTEKKQ